MDDSINYKRDVRIDPDNLDVELLEQPDLVLKYGSLLSEARSLVDMLKEKSDLAFSQAMIAAFEEVKSPADKVKAHAQVNEKYLDLQDQYLEAKRHLGILQVAYDAVNARKSSLENLTKFYLNTYFSSAAYGQEPPNLSDRQRNFHTRKGAQEAVKNRATEAAKTAGRKVRTNA